MSALLPLIDELVRREDNRSETVLSGLESLQKNIAGIFEEVKRDFEGLEERLELREAQRRQDEADKANQLRALNDIRDQNRALAEAVRDVDDKRRSAVENEQNCKRDSEAVRV
jgi:hypothetical protein